jgi:hypothetical protein
MLLRWCRASNELCQVATLVIEIGAICIFFHKRVTITLLLAFVGLHIGIFAASGIFFWKWIVVNVTVLFVLWRLTTEQKQQLYSWTARFTSVLLIILAPYFFSPLVLAWWDTRYSTRFEIEAIGESGQIYPLRRHAMAPYDLTFSQNDFFYLSPQPVVTGVYGSTMDFALATELKYGKSIAELQEKFGKMRYNADMASRFDDFLQTYFRHLNTQLDCRLLLERLPAPFHIWSGDFPNGYARQERIRELRVRQITEWQPEVGPRAVEDTIVRRIRVPGDAEGAPIAGGEEGIAAGRSTANVATSGRAPMR